MADNRIILDSCSAAGLGICGLAGCVGLFGIVSNYNSVAAHHGWRTMSAGRMSTISVAIIVVAGGFALKSLMSISKIAVMYK